MKKAFYIIVIPLLLMVSAGAYAQSNKGTEFWTAFMAHNNGVTSGSPASMVLYITSDISTTGSVEIGGVAYKTFTVTANQVTFVEIPTTAYMNSFGLFTNTGIHITSVAPIAVYAHIYAMNASGATLLLPVNAMGKDYLSLNYTQKSNAAATNPAFSTFDIIGTEANTTVAITPSADLLDGHPANITFNVTLNKGEVYQELSNTDLTGSKIQSISTNTGTCKKIAVFSGSTRIGIGCVTNGKDPNTLSSDNLFQQVYPTSTWGKNYIAAPLEARPYDVYRIVLSDPNTNVTLNGNAVPLALFTNGLYYEFNSTTTNIISADKPIQVVQYSPTQNQQIDCTIGVGDIGDPEMIYLSPIEQGLTHVTFYATGYYKILQSYVNVIIPTAGASSFKMDGASYANNFIPIPNSTYSYAQLAISSGPQSNGSTTSVTAGTHNMDASVPFNAIAYGFGSAESYGYAAGANLLDFTESVNIENSLNSNTVQGGGCSNITYNTQVTIPFQTTQITWSIDGVNVFTDNNPVLKSPPVIKDNKLLYTYQYNAAVNFTVGNHAIKATVFNPTADECGSNQEIENDFTITAPPPADFKVAPTDCLGDSTAFKDNTTYASGETAKSWLWDFGDNTLPSTLQNPLHKYAAIGNYVVHLTIVDDNGCTEVSAPKNVHVVSKPVANFDTSSPDCLGQAITFTNTSTAADGTIVSSAWDFGDGTPITNIANTQPTTHIYMKPGTYTVKLAVTTDVGCTSDSLNNTVTVNPLPVVKFVIPDACLGDGFASFINGSSIADGTEADFTYLWDFGDQNSSAADNQSTLQNPKHTYTAVGQYIAKLTVTSKYGCAVTALKTFNVNGSNLNAVFDPESNCSGEDIVFDNKSTIDAYITKVVWHFDVNGQPGVVETYADSTLHADGKYTHKYPAFNTPATVPVDVELDVFSGQTCTATLKKTIYLNAKPLVGLSANNNVINTTNNLPDTVTICYADAPVQITENKGVYTGTGAFSGAGITSSGLFDPQKAGVGNSTINYLFTAVTGCTYTASFVVKVNPTPNVTLPANYTMLEGTELTLRPVVSIAGGGNLTYKWTPTDGLSADNVANPVVNPSNDTKYTLTVTSDKGCSTTVQTTVKVLKLPVVPNAFTPNGDGINDTWEIKYLDTYPNVTVEVFNRYGSKVFYSNGYGVPWNGKFNGADLPVGTYYYIINPNSGRKPLTGYLSIIR